MAENRTPPEEQRKQFTSESGAFFRILHMERRVRVYPLQEGEMTTLSVFNTLAIVFFSAGTGLLTFAVGLITDSIIEGRLTDSSRVLVYAVTPLCLVLALLSYCVAIWALRSRSSELDRIREESGQS